MKGEARNAKPYTLDCLHVVWLMHAPLLHDRLWCTKCRVYEPLLLAATSTHAEIYDASGEFMAKRVGQKVHGTCLYKECHFRHETATTYNALTKAMHSHYMREHTKWATIEIKRQKRLPRNSEPPF